jgi:yersiniabactin nonribosomal peptide synthetase
VTVWNSVPQLFQLLVDYLELRPEHCPPTLRLVLLSGDWIPLTLPDRARRLWPELQIIGLGGATEASIWSIHHRIDGTDPRWSSVPYGKPLGNQRFHVLDEHLRPRPVWVPGRLFIGGVGLAKEYWRKPAETAARFITHPESGERLYDTGDLGRYLPDGNIEFLGREDFQVKINGYRVELGEIAAAIQQHPGVHEVLVDTVGDDRSNKQLAAYVVPVTRPEDPGDAFEIQHASPEVRAAWDAAVTAGREQLPPGDAELRQLGALWRQLEQLSTEAMCHALRELGAFGAAGETHGVKELAAASRIKPHYEKLLAQWLQTLSEDGFLDRLDASTFRSPRPLPTASLDALRSKLHGGAWSGQVPELIQYFERSISNLVGLFRGEVDALELLFPGGSWQTAESIYQHNPMAVYINQTAQRVLRAAAASLPADAPLRVLEVGAGTGGTTGSLLPVLPPERTVYTYTDLSTFFTDRAREKFQSHPFLDFRLFDLDVDPLRQGYTPHSYDVIVAANVLHDAHHVSVALDHLETLLAPGGLLLAVETTRNTRLHLISVAFIEGLGDYQDERLETNRPLLDTAQWQRAFASRGFERSAFFPGAGSPAELFGQHVLVAQGPTAVSRFRTESLIRHLQAKLPEYMVPKHVFELKQLPLSANGKIDRRALPTLRSSTAASPQSLAPSTPLERSIVALWQESLKVEQVGIHDNFFALGGDSLIAMQLAGRINAAYRVEVPLRRVFETPTVAGLAALLRDLGVDPTSPDPTSPDPDEPTAR